MLKVINAFFKTMLIYYKRRCAETL